VCGLVCVRVKERESRKCACVREERNVINHLPFSKKLTGIDIGEELINIAKEKHTEIKYQVELTNNAKMSFTIDTRFFNSFNGPIPNWIIDINAEFEEIIYTRNEFDFCYIMTKGPINFNNGNLKSQLNFFEIL
jgi:hypothetical protein